MDHFSPSTTRFNAVVKIWRKMSCYLSIFLLTIMTLQIYYGFLSKAPCFVRRLLLMWNIIHKFRGIKSVSLVLLVCERVFERLMMMIIFMMKENYYYSLLRRALFTNSYDEKKRNILIEFSHFCHRNWISLRRFDDYTENVAHACNIKSHS